MAGDRMDLVYTGQLSGLPDKQSSVVRIFVSSTFTDTTTERNWLMKNAVPELRTFCQERGLDFQIVDMRWGVRDEATDDHQTTQLCLHAIKNCQQMSLGPNFVAFLGDKYGHRPLPSEIEASEFLMIKKTAAKKGYDTSLLTTWYQCDYNREPSMLILQPISSLLPAFLDMSVANSSLRQQAQREWWSVMEKLAKMLRDVMDTLYEEGKVTETERHKYYQSVTEAEVLAGILTPEDTQDKVVCFQRTFYNMDLKTPVAGRFTDLLDGVRNSEAEELCEKLRMIRLPAVLPHGSIFRYNVPWDSSAGVNISKNAEQNRYISQFGNDFITSLKAMISTGLETLHSSKGRSPLFEEILHHLHFCRAKCETFCGREQLLHQIRDLFETRFGQDENVLSEEMASKADEQVESEQQLNYLSEDGISEEITENGIVSEEISEDDMKDRNEITDAEKEIKNRAEGVNEEHRQMGDMLEGMGVKFTVGDTFDDKESDPSHNMRAAVTSLPDISEYTKPVVVYGTSGCGKTALTAKILQLSHSWFPHSVGIIRFLGTSTMSMTIREVLKSLCLQISHVYNVMKPAGIDLDSDFQFLLDYFNALLWKIDSSQRPLVIILDSVDQLQPSDHAHKLHWLPHKLPPNVHLLISMVSDRLDCLTNVRNVFPQLDQYVEVTAMEESSASDMIKVLSVRVGKHLAKKQHNLLLRKFAQCGQPLYLKLLTDMALSWKSYTPVDEEALGLTIKEAISHLFDNLERNHGSVLIKKAIGYLCAAREGLTDVEIEDLLSLDDEALQDTYIYHLPPDPDVVRMPSFVWKRVEYDIQEYLVERQSGTRKMVTWYHRQFLEAAQQRYLACTAGLPRPGGSRPSYLAPGVKAKLHAQLVEYFQGVWSDKSKPLELTKGKKGSYPNAFRQVPAQPIKFTETLFNVRKLSELPYHMIESGQFHVLMDEVLCNPDWLHGKCCAISLTALLEDLKLAMETLAKVVEKEAVVVADQERQEPHRNKKSPEAEQLRKDEEILSAMTTLAHMLILASEPIRKDPVYLPQQILSQLGPSYSGGTHMELLVSRCTQWCETSSASLMVPLTPCLTMTGGKLSFTINVEVQLTGDKRDELYSCMYLREDTLQLYTVQQRSAQPDQLCVFDLSDYGSCVVTENVDQYVRSIQLVGNNKYLLLDLYTKKDPYDPVCQQKLYLGSTSSPVTVTHPATVIVVSQSGKYIAYASGNLVTVCRADTNMQQVLTIKDHNLDVTTMLISPDETLLVTSDIVQKSFTFGKSDDHQTLLFDLKTKKHVNTLDPTLHISQHTPITKENLLLCVRSGYKESGTLVVWDLLNGVMKNEVKINEMYKLDILQLHSSHSFILSGHHGTSIINGIRNKFAEFVKIATCERVGRSPVQGPVTSMRVFGEDELFYALGFFGQNRVYIMYAGTVNDPLPDAVVIHELIGHNQPIISILVPSTMVTILTASQDNTIKVWNLASILADFHQQTSVIRASMEHENDVISAAFVQKPKLAEVMEKFKPPHSEERAKTTQLAFNRFGDSVYVGTSDGDMRLYNAEDGRLQLSTPLNIGAVTNMMLSQNGRYMIIAGNNIHVEDLLSQDSRILTPRARINCMAENNSILVAGSAGMEAKGRVWNIQTGEVIKDFELLYSLYCVAINSAGTKIVSSMFDFPMVMDIHSDESSMMDPHNMDTMMSGATVCCVSPDDKMAACGSTDGAVRVIQMDGTYIYRLQQKSSAISLVFSLDNVSLLSAGYRSIYVWSLKDGSLRYKLTRHTDFINDLKFDSTGQFLVTISRDRQLVLWDYHRRISIATFHAQCQIRAMGVSTGATYIAYIPEGNGEVAILKPNVTLRDKMLGKFTTMRVMPQAEAMALAFCNKRGKKKGPSRMCTVM